MAKAVANSQASLKELTTLATNIKNKLKDVISGLNDAMDDTKEVYLLKSNFLYSFSQHLLVKSKLKLNSRILQQWQKIERKNFSKKPKR